MSPILVRPVREQLEHDRLIRHLQTKYNKKFDVAINVGDQQENPVKIGTATFFPDLVLASGKRLAGLVEVESAESVNNLEALAQWVNFSRARVPFHLYVPAHVFDTARRLCDATGATVTEIWTYRAASLDVFDLIRIFTGPGPSARVSRAASIPPKPPPPKPAPEPPPPPPPPVTKAPAAPKGAGAAKAGPGKAPAGVKTAASAKPAAPAKAPMPAKAPVPTKVPPPIKAPLPVKAPAAVKAPAPAAKTKPAKPARPVAAKPARKPGKPAATKRPAARAKSRPGKR